MAGPVLVPGDPGFAEEVTGYNLATVTAPAVVVGATSADDVAAAVRWAAAAGRKVAVQATGHGLYADLGGAVLISHPPDGRRARRPRRWTARVGAGARWRAVIDAAAPHGLAPLNGSSSTVGVVGYTPRRRPRSAEPPLRVRRRPRPVAWSIVTADGADPRGRPRANDPDLFWAMRGGKGNLGIVTEIEFDLMPVARFYGGGIFFPAAAARGGAARLADLGPDPAGGRVHLGRAAPAAARPGAARAAARAVRRRMCGSPTSAPRTRARRARPDACGRRAAARRRRRDALRRDRRRAHGPGRSPMPSVDRGAPWRSLPAEAVDALLAAGRRRTSVSPLVVVELRLLGGAIARPAGAERRRGIATPRSPCSPSACWPARRPLPCRAR